MKKHYFLFLSLLSLIFTSCSESSQQTEKDQNAERIVCVSKQLTEIVFALGANDKLVGVDLSSTYPKEAQKLTNVGYHRMLSAEGIISLRPSLVIHNGGIGPEEVVKQLEKVGIPLKAYPDTKTIAEVKDLFRQVGKDFNAEKKAEELCEKLDQDMGSIQEKAAKYKDKPKVVIIHFGRVVNNYLVVGQKSNATQMLQWAGAVNAIDAGEGMKPINPEMIAKANPDVILATDFGFDRMGGLEKFKSLAGIALTNAGKNNKIYRIEEHDLIYLGPRTGENVLKLMKLIHEGDVSVQ